MENVQFDIVFHLLGKERIPIAFGMLQFPALNHIFITTKDYEEAGKVMSKYIPNIQAETLVIDDPFKPASTRKIIENKVKQLPQTAKIGLNATGGTKPMFAGALSACWNTEIEPFYFEIQEHNIIFLRDGHKIPFVGIKKIDNFFNVAGYNIVTQGFWNDKIEREKRKHISEKIWEKRGLMGNLYSKEEFKNYINKKMRDIKIQRGYKPNPPFNFEWEKSRATLSQDGKIEFVLDGEILEMPTCRDFGWYLGGCWLEEYVYSLLRTIEEEFIFDLRIGLEINAFGKVANNYEMPFGEFDCVFTDGKRLWLVECKAGMIKQEHIQKLENNLKNYGGMAACGILISSFSANPAHKERLKYLKSIKLICGKDLNIDTFRKIFAATERS